MIWHEVIDGVYAVRTDLGTELWQRCLHELQSCQDLSANHYYTEPNLGAKDIMVQGAACDSVSQYFASDQWLERVVDLCSKDCAWSTNWGNPSLKWFRIHTSFQSEWQLAPPDYVNHEWHVDCLRMVVHGLMYLTPIHDDRSTTLFRQGVEQVAISTGFDHGWVLLQNGRQEHRGINNTNIPRYVFKWMYTLKL